MISDYHKYHGAVLSVLSSERPHTAINKLEDSSQGEYQINHDLGLYIKHATSNENTWIFNFQPTHQEDIRRMARRYNGKLHLALVCVTDEEKIDGVCLITYSEYLRIVDADLQDQKNVIVERPQGGSYRVSGPDGYIDGTIRQSRFPAKIIETMA